MKNLVLTKIEDAVGTLTLNNPEQYNSLTPEFLEMIQTGFNELIEDRSSKVIVLKAEGKVFSTGGNVKGFYDNLPRIKEYSMETVGLLNQVILLMIKSPLPIIAVVHGMVTGGSLGFVLASDLILITPQTTFTPYYSVVGYSPDGGWTALLPSIIGRKRAAEIMMLNKTITAEQSVLWGIANQIVEKDKINDEAEKTARNLIRHKTESIRRTKELLWSDIDSIADKLGRELEEFINQIQTTEAREGMKQFLKK